jgi:hypothetical protein
MVLLRARNTWAVFFLMKELEAPMKEPVAQSQGGSQSSESGAAIMRARVLTKAAIRVAGQLGLGQAELARVIGISAATASRMHAGAWVIPEQSKTWELVGAGGSVGMRDVRLRGLNLVLR